MKISDEKWAELRRAVMLDDKETFERLIREIVRTRDPLAGVTRVIEYQGRKYYGFD